MTLGKAAIKEENEGPLATGFLLTAISAEMQLGAVALAIGAALLYWKLSPAH